MTVTAVISQNCRHCFIVTGVDRKCSDLLKAAYLGLDTFFSPLDCKSKSLDTLTESLLCLAVTYFSFANASALCSLECALSK